MASGGQQGTGCAEAQFDPEPGKQIGVGAGYAAMSHVAENEQGFAREFSAPRLTQRKSVQQGLCGVGMPAIPRIDHGTAQPFGQKLGRAAAGITQYHHIGIHGLEGKGGILEGFAFLDTGAGLAQRVRVGGKALARDIKRCLGARAVFRKEQHDGLALKGGNFFDRAAVDLMETAGGVQQVHDFVHGQPADVEEVFMRPGMCLRHDVSLSLAEKKPFAGAKGCRRKCAPEYRH